MKPMWILETNVFDENCFEKMISHFKFNNIPYETVRIIPFIHEIDGKIPIVNSDKVICYGSIGIQKLAQKNNWNPGVWTNENFNSSSYKNIGDWFLNNDSQIMKISEVDTNVSHNQFFIKPNSDNKEFAGQVIDKEKFVSWYENMKSIGYLDDNDFDVAVCCPKAISVEYRVVVVNKKIVAGSLYKKYGIVYTERGWLLEFQDYIDEINWHPADVYVVDFGLSNEGWKIIEYNTFNSAGLYACNVSRIIDAINNFVS